ncbi:unnamed protein product [Ilex paraguariensis]|uniref:Uncharacterized protein n=1 Tax=Ilex paraguariensis TaxID=185542 RepID=A0ABC8TLL4_9AQUA
MASMKEKKSGRRFLWLCCSVIELKEKKKKITDTDSDGGPHQNDVSSIIFGRESKRSSAFVCCSVIGGPPPSPKPLHDQKIDHPSDMGMAKSALAVVPVPHKDV